MITGIFAALKSRFSLVRGRLHAVAVGGAMAFGNTTEDERQGPTPRCRALLVSLAFSGQNQAVRPSQPDQPGYERRRLASALLAILVAAGTVGCTGLRRERADSGAAPPVVASQVAGPTASPTVAPANPKQPRVAPSKAFPVGTRTLTVTRSSDRRLRTTIWFPQARAGGVAAGRFPVVVFSHGLHGLPSDYRALATRWAAAGFIVVAPSYPHTSRGVPAFDLADVLNQPADASYVLTRVLALDAASGDPLRGHLNTGRVAAAGHSAGAITTVGMFAKGRDARLDAGVVLAGNAIGMGESYVGEPAALLFVHGDKDPLTPYSLGWATYNAAPATWPRAFLTLPGQGHIDPYLRPEKRAFAAVAATTTDFLRWTLYGDAAAKARLAKDAGKGNRLDARLS